jgi:hypothetical protein
MTTAVTSAAHATDRTRPLKILCGVICCLILVTDRQVGLVVLAGAWTAHLFFRRGGHAAAWLLVAANLLLNLAFFMSHPIFTSHYTIPIAMLSLWTLLFASLLQPTEAVDRGLAGRAASAGS